MALVLWDDDALTQHLVSIVKGTWQTSDEVGSIFLGGSAVVVGVSHVGFTLNFVGTSIALYGHVLSDTFPTNDTFNNVIIDIWSSENVFLPRSNTIDLWYQSPQLEDTNTTHNITFDDFPTMLIDYAIVSAGNETMLSGQSLLVDNTSPDIAYQGNWISRTGIITAANGTTRVPVGGSLYQTTDRAASAVFQFAGTSVSVYGVSPTKDGVVLDCDLDRTVAPSRQYSASLFDPNFLWFSQDNLEPNNHTLIMTFASESTAINFTLDYITYKPSFATLADKPDSPPQSIQKEDASNSQQTLRKIIIGSVVGPCVTILLIFCVWMWKKRRASISGAKPSMSEARPFLLGSFAENGGSLGSFGEPILDSTVTTFQPTHKPGFGEARTERVQNEEANNNSGIREIRKPSLTERRQRTDTDNTPSSSQVWPLEVQKPRISGVSASINGNSREELDGRHPSSTTSSSSNLWPSEVHKPAISDTSILSTHNRSRQESNYSFSFHRNQAGTGSDSSQPEISLELHKPVYTGPRREAERPGEESDYSLSFHRNQAGTGSDSSRQETSLERHKPVYTRPLREAEGPGKHKRTPQANVAIEERRQDATSGESEDLGMSSDLSAGHRADGVTDSQAAIADAILTFEEQRKPALPSTLRMGRPSETVLYRVGLVRGTDELPNDGDNLGIPGELETSHNRIPGDHIDADEVLIPSLQEYRKPRLRVSSIEGRVQRDVTEFHRGQLNGGQETASAQAEVPFETLPILQQVRIAPESSPLPASAVVQSAHTASSSPLNRRQSRWWSFRRSEHSPRHVEPFMLFSPESYSAETGSDNPDNPSTSTTRALGPVTERGQEQGEMHEAILSTTPSGGVLVREMLERAHQRLTRLENVDRGRREDDLPPPPYHEET